MASSYFGTRCTLETRLTATASKDIPERHGLNNASRYAGIKLRPVPGTEMRAKKMRILQIALLVLASYGTAWAQQTPPTAAGLGQSWPNAPDVSSSPQWHVYVFERDGVRFVQVNDLNGTVRGAFAVAGGQFLRLPIGTDSQFVSTPQQPRKTAAVTHTAPSQTVYQDNVIKVLATPQSQGRVMLDADCQDKRGCGG